jgi:catechol 2,3-dioxygenase-like lactoylglutathione lyase family enzyme
MTISRRRHAVPTLLVIASVLGLPMLPANPAPTVATVRVEGVGLTVADAGRAAEFYATVLLFERVSDVERQGPNSRGRVIRMRLGDDLLELIEDPAAGRSLQRMAIVVNDIEQAYLWLHRHRVRPRSPAPRPDWNPETGDVRAVHFNDPDGHALALVQFPADAGTGRWRRPTDRVFLGIARSTPVGTEVDQAVRSAVSLRE